MAFNRSINTSTGEPLPLPEFLILALDQKVRGENIGRPYLALLDGGVFAFQSPPMSECDRRPLLLGTQWMTDLLALNTNEQFKYDVKRLGFLSPVRFGEFIHHNEMQNAWHHLRSYIKASHIPGIPLRISEQEQNTLSIRIAQAFQDPNFYVNGAPNGRQMDIIEAFTLFALALGSCCNGTSPFALANWRDPRVWAWAATELALALWDMEPGMSPDTRSCLKVVTPQKRQQTCPIRCKCSATSIFGLKEWDLSTKSVWGKAIAFY